MNVKLFTAFVFFVIAIVVLPTNGYPKGVPQEACDKLEPKHLTNKRQRSNSPFTFTTSKTRFAKNEVVTITVEGKNATTNAVVPFKGILLVARKPGSRANVGTFKSGTNIKAINCTTDRDAASHNNGNAKNRVTVEWMAPDNFTGGVSFTGVVVQDFDNYWTNIRSRPINIV